MVSPFKYRMTRSSSLFQEMVRRNSSAFRGHGESLSRFKPPVFQLSKQKPRSQITEFPLPERNPPADSRQNHFLIMILEGSKITVDQGRNSVSSAGRGAPFCFEVRLKGGCPVTSRTAFFMQQRHKMPFSLNLMREQAEATVKPDSVRRPLRTEGVLPAHLLVAVQGWQMISSSSQRGKGAGGIKSNRPPGASMRTAWSVISFWILSVIGPCSS